jgi:hypothetical protein
MFLNVIASYKLLLGVFVGSRRILAPTLELLGRVAVVKTMQSQESTHGGINIWLLIHI